MLSFQIKMIMQRYKKKISNKQVFLTKHVIGKIKISAQGF
jgi:hypothetical protein